MLRATRRAQQGGAVTPARASKAVKAAKTVKAEPSGKSGTRKARHEPRRSHERQTRARSVLQAKAERELKSARVAKASKVALGAHGKLPVNGASSPRKASCTACGLCCSYVAIEVDGPSTVKQATLLLWYVYHDQVSLYVNGDDWMVQFDTTCIYLQPDYRCGVYTTRPHICREFSEQDCEVNTGDDGHTFYTAGEFMEHLKQTRPRIHSFVRKHFAPPDEAPRTELAPFEHRFRAVLSRREAAGV